MTTQEAKDFLRRKGYFVDNLWHVTDVQNKFNCTDEEAQNILYWSLGNDHVIEQINESIWGCGMINKLQEK